MSSVCSNASLKTWTPLHDHFIDEHLVEMFPLFDQVNRQRYEQAPAASPKSGSLPGSGQDCWLATELE